jgi:hypothetical protein
MESGEERRGELNIDLTLSRRRDEFNGWSLNSVN